MSGSYTWYNCKKPNSAGFATLWRLKKSQIQRAFHPSEWHHSYLKYGDAAKAYYYAYNRDEIATILKQARQGKFEDLNLHHSHLAGGKIGEENYMLKIWKEGLKKRLALLGNNDRIVLKQKHPCKIFLTKADKAQAEYLNLKFLRKNRQSNGDILLAGRLMTRLKKMAAAIKFEKKEKERRQKHTALKNHQLDELGLSVEKTTSHGGNAIRYIIHFASINSARCKNPKDGFEQINKQLENGFKFNLLPQAFGY